MENRKFISKLFNKIYAVSIDKVKNYVLYLKLNIIGFEKFFNKK